MISYSSRARHGDGHLRHAAGRDRSLTVVGLVGGQGSRSPLGGLVEPSSSPRPSIAARVGRRDGETLRPERKGQVSLA